MRTRILLCAAVLSGLLWGSAALAREAGWGRVYTVSSKVTVRENPVENALQVRVLKSGQKVRVDFESDGWAAVFDPAEPLRAETRAQGYVRLSELRSGARPETTLLAEKSEKSMKPDPPEKSKPSAASDESAKSARKESRKVQQAQVFGEIRVADRKMTVRAGRDKETAFVRLLQPGQRVRVDFHEDGWFAVFDPDEKVRDLARAWGYGRDKFLLLEKDFALQPQPEVAEAAAKETPSKTSQKPKTDEAVGYSVLARQVDQLRPLAPVVLRVRLDTPVPPAPEALRKIVREIWKAERRKNEDLQVEVLFPGMDQSGLAYSVARFHEDGRLKEFWWREVLLRTNR
jgi:hypothetical protein